MSQTSTSCAQKQFVFIKQHQYPLLKARIILGQRLRNFYIFVYNPDVATWSDFDKKPGQLCFFYKGQAPNVSSVTCNESHGRYLKIFKKNQQVSGNISSTDDLDALSLCEVEIFVDLNPLKGKIYFLILT